MPIPNSHQEKNISYISERGGAIWIREANSSVKDLADKIISVFKDSALMASMGEKLHSALPVTSQDKIIQIIESLKNSA